MTRWIALLLALAPALGAAPLVASAADADTPLHPPVLLLDRDGTKVLESGKPISTMRTCGGCHDTKYIATHSYHSQLGRDERAPMGTVAGRRGWDTSPGQFGRWSPLAYRYLTSPGDSRLDLGVAEWLQLQGWRHVGGGPAVYGHGEEPLDARPGRSATGAFDPDSHVLDAATGKPRPWDWQASGVMEMDCFLCHAGDPDNSARREELAAGRFGWANTATLAKTGVTRRDGDQWAYVPSAFQRDGTVTAGRLGIQTPTNRNCGQCHGQTHFGPEPLKLDLSLSAWSTATKGQVFSPQRISDSAVNLQDKQALTRPWDVHAEALLECSSCHFSLNDPASYEPTQRDGPEHLAFEPRRLSVGQYLRRPSHQFAKGQTAQGTVARHLDGTMRGCDDCHDTSAGHDWLPYREIHFRQLSCEACHIPKVYAPAVQQVDWTLPSPQGRPRMVWRGIDGELEDPAAQVEGFTPVLLARDDLDGQTRLVPHNLIASWYWVEGGPTPRPARLADLKAAIAPGGKYHDEILAAFDADGDGGLDTVERTLDTAEKVAAVRNRLEAVGVIDPRIEAEVQPHGIHHGVAPARWATRECEMCHTGDSRLAEPMMLATYVPGDVEPAPVGDSGVSLHGSLETDSHGALSFRPSTRRSSLYVLGHDRWTWVSVLGTLALAGVVVGAGVHTALRIRSARNGGQKHASEMPAEEAGQEDGDKRA